MNKKYSNVSKKYYLGLDIGTESVGWAVTDASYKLLRANNKKLWGVRLFDEAQQAKDRRVQRESRRRLERRKWRLGLLKQIFASVVNRVDPNFYARLDDSNLYGGDKRENTKFSLFSDTNFNDADFHKKYKTIYHLRSAMLTEENPDPRLVYLALHHIVKYRGHFLIEGENVSAIEDIAQPLQDINSFLDEREEVNGTFNLNKIDDFRKLLIAKTGKSKRAQSYIECFDVNKNKPLLTILKMTAGNSVYVKDLPVNCDNQEMKVCFDDNWDSKEADLRENLQDDFILIEKAKMLYDYSRLKSVLGEYKYISQGMTSKYDKHKADLQSLKLIMRRYFSKEQYDAMFRNALKKDQTNYTAYSGRLKFGKKAGKKTVLKAESQSRSYEDFVKYVKSTLLSNEKAMQDEKTASVLSDIEAGTFMPKQVSKNNAALPYQLNLSEMDAILDNVQRFPNFSFLFEKDEHGVTVRDKIRSLLTFRLPYYVGPINNSGGKYWVVKNGSGQILPWNFEQKIDLEQTERNFVERMTNDCPYVKDAKVLPKCSLLYEEFVFLNIINKIRINNEPLQVDLKNKLSQYFALFGTNKLTKKFLKQWLIEQNVVQSSDDLQIEGFDDGAAVHRRTYYQFVKIFGSADEVENKRNDIERIIRFSTIAGSEKGNLVKWIKKNFRYMSDEQVTRIKGLTCKGWGRYSNEFLTMRSGTNLETGEVKSLSVMDILRSTTYNFMEIWNNADYGFAKAISDQRIEEYESVTYRLVDELYCSPAVKKQIWQALSIVKELTEIIGCAPTKIFVEVARGSDPKREKSDERKRTTSRFEQIFKALEKLKSENNELYLDMSEKFSEVEAHKERLQNHKLYLYFMQNGIDLYTGERIDYNHLELYDKDHIYPRSKVKDDSIHNNLVLTERTQNAKKTDEYPISDSIRSNPKILAIWKSLRKQGLMSEEKFKRLTRITPLSNEELAEFINRQIVETRQTTKEVIGLLKRMFAGTNCDVVWSKASNISDFRAMPKCVGDTIVPRFVKCRELNDLHHAKDAYLNIVVGNVYNVKYGHNAKFWLKSYPDRNITSSAKLFDSDVKTQSVTAWTAGENGTVLQVEKTMRSNAILFTRESKVAKGALFNATIEKKDETYSKELVPLKGASSKNVKYSKMSDTSKYGGYNNESRVYYMLVKYSEKKIGRAITTQKIKYKFLGVTAKDASKLIDDDARINYCVNCGLNEPKILIEKIKIQTMFEIGGTLLTLSGMTGRQLIWRLALQNAQDGEYERYLKKVVNVVEKRKKDLKYCASSLDGITSEQNKIMLDCIADSLLSDKYSGASSLVSFAEKLRNCEIKNKFASLSLTEQCVVICECSKALQCNALASDLSLIGEGKSCGKILTSSVFDCIDKIKIVHRSVTGVFERKIPLSEFDR